MQLLQIPILCSDTMHDIETLFLSPSSKAQVFRRYDTILQHETQSRHWIGIDPGFLDLDAIWTTFVFHVPEAESCFHHSAPLLAFVVGNRALNIFEPDESSRMAEQSPAVTLFPAVLVLVSVVMLYRNAGSDTHQQTKNVGSCL